MSNIKIFESKDHKNILKIFSDDKYVREYLERNYDGYVFEAKDNDCSMGCLLMSKRCIERNQNYHIDIIYVLPQYRRKKVGQSLVNYAENIAKNEKTSISCRPIPDAFLFWKACSYFKLRKDPGNFMWGKFLKIEKNN